MLKVLIYYQFEVISTADPSEMFTRHKLYKKAHAIKVAILVFVWLKKKPSP